jgi:hypothetical protein
VGKGKRSPGSSKKGAALEKPLKNKRDVYRTVHHVQFVLGAVAFLLGLVFTIRKFQSVPTIPMLDDTWSRFFVHAAIAIYFWAWIGGSGSDVRAQARVIQRLVGSVAQIHKMLWGGALLLGVVFIALTYADSFLEFCVELAGFLALDVVSWRLYYRRKLRPMFTDSRRIAREDGDLWGVREVDIVDRFMSGGWRYARWATGAVLLALLAVASELGWMAALAARVGALTEEMVRGLGVLMYVVVIEVWVWYFRLQRSAQLRIVELLEQEERL